MNLHLNEDIKIMRYLLYYFICVSFSKVFMMLVLGKIWLAKMCLNVLFSITLFDLIPLTLCVLENISTKNGNEANLF